MRIFYEFLLRCDKTGAFQGAHVRYLDSYTKSSGAEALEVSEPELVLEKDLDGIAPDLGFIVPELNLVAIRENDRLRQELEAAQVLTSDLNDEKNNLAQQVLELQQQLVVLQTQLAEQQPPALPVEDWKALSDALIASDFDEWLAGAFAYPVLALHVIRLLSALSTGDLQTLYQSWLTIIAQHPPSGEQLQAWQAIADSLNITSLKFVVEPQASQEI